MTVTIYGYPGNPRTRIAKIIAYVQDIELELSEVIPRQNINRDELIRNFPRSNGKIPVLRDSAISLTEIPAIAVYLAKLKPSNLLGDGSLQQEADVLSWVNWANQELLMTMSRWFLPLIPGLERPAPYDHSAVEAGKVAALVLLDNLENNITGRDFLVGDHFTLADIFLAIVISRGCEWILDTKWRAKHPEIMRHFTSVSVWEPVKATIPEFKLIESSVENTNPYK